MYTHPIYGFSFQLPSDWVVVETTTGDQILNGHLVDISPRIPDEKLNLRLTYQRTGDDVLIWSTSVGAGEFVRHGGFAVADGSVQRTFIICPIGQINSICNQDERGSSIHRGDFEFGFILRFSGIYCLEGYSLIGKVQHIGKLIVASLQAPWLIW